MLLNPLEAYRRWAPTYDHQPNPLTALERRTLASLLGDVRGLHIVDVACGTGYWARRLQHDGSQTVGFDFCEEMVKEGCRHRHVGPHLFLADAAYIPLRAGYAELTLCSLAFSYFPQPEQVFFEMARITRKGGRVLVSDMHPAAVAAGWQRSFRSGGVAYSICQRTGSTERAARLSSKAGLRLLDRTDARFGWAERALFAEAGRPDLFAQATRIPAIQIDSWIRQ